MATMLMVRNHLNISEGAFLGKELTAKSPPLFSQKRSIVYVPLDCQYASTGKMTAIDKKEKNSQNRICIWLVAGTFDKENT